MIYLSSELVIPRKPELVWSVLVDVVAYSSWVEGLREVEHTSGPTFGEGAAFDVIFAHTKSAMVVGNPRDARVLATTEITRCLEPKLLATETRVRGRLVLLDRLELTACAEGTRLAAMTELVEDPGVSRLFARSSGLLGAATPERGPQKIYDRSFKAFKLLVEARTAAPYR